MNNSNEEVPGKTDDGKGEKLAGVRRNLDQLAQEIRAKFESDSTRRETDPELKDVSFDDYEDWRRDSLFDLGHALDKSLGKILGHDAASAEELSDEAIEALAKALEQFRKLAS